MPPGFSGACSFAGQGKKRAGASRRGRQNGAVGRVSSSAALCPVAMNVRYFDEFKWAEDNDGTAWFFRDESGEHVAEVVLNDPDSKMWRFLVNVPPRYRFNG